MMLYKLIAQELVTLSTYIPDDKKEMHEDILDEVKATFFLSGSGFDDGVILDRKLSSREKLVFNTAYHAMNDAGYYSDWYYFSCTVRPSLPFDFTMKISRGIPYELREYIEDALYHMLVQNVEFICSDDGALHVRKATS